VRAGSGVGSQAIVACYFEKRADRSVRRLSAWESDRSGSLTALTWASDAPRVTVTDPAAPGLMARQWPVDCHPGCQPWGRSGSCTPPTSTSGIQSRPHEAGWYQGVLHSRLRPALAVSSPDLDVSNLTPVSPAPRVPGWWIQCRAAG